MAFFGTGPKQRDIVFVVKTVPSSLSIRYVAQKAKDVLTEPVLLLMDTVKGFDTLLPGVQVSHGKEGTVALTNNRSFEVHELAAGKVCAINVDDAKIKNAKHQAFK